MKTHEFRLEVKSALSRDEVRVALLLIFALRNKRGCEFMLKNLPPSANTGASVERAAIKRAARRLSNKWAEQYGTCRDVYNNAIEDVIQFINTRTKRTAARNGGLGRK